MKSGKKRQKWIESKRRGKNVPIKKSYIHVVLSLEGKAQPNFFFEKDSFHILFRLLFSFFYCYYFTIFFSVLFCIDMFAMYETYSFIPIHNQNFSVTLRIVLKMAVFVHRTLYSNNRKNSFMSFCIAPMQYHFFVSIYAASAPSRSATEIKIKTKKSTTRSPWRK